MLVGFSYAMHVYYIYCLIKLMIDWLVEKNCFRDSYSFFEFVFCTVYVHKLPEPSEASAIIDCLIK